MADARPRETVESSVMRSWRAYEHAAEQLSPPMLDTSPRAVKTRAILRIAQTYNWQSAIARFMDSHGAGHLTDLSDEQLDALHDRMQSYLDSAMLGCDTDECLPAY